MRKLLASICLVAVVSAPAFAAGQTAKPAPRAADDFTLPGPPEAAPAALASAIAAVRAPALAAHVRFLASPALEGRGLGSRGLDTAVEYAAAALALAGIPPLAGGTKKDPVADAYFQLVPVREIRGATGEVTVETRRGGQSQSRSFLSGVDCLLPEVGPQSVTAPVVFVAHGIHEEALGRDDFKDLDVRGKAVLVLAGTPAGPEWRTPVLAGRWAAEKSHERWAAKLEAARAAGAAAVLAVEGNGLTGEEPPAARFYVPLAAPVEAPLVRVSTALADALLAGAGFDTTAARVEAPRMLRDVRVTIRIVCEERRIESRNVVGVLPGGDPKLRDEAVMIGAHLDHLGKVGDAVYPGADDNASGVAALLEIAKALAASPQRPKRTLVFSFWTGEEEGKLGSGYWVGHPPWPLARTAVYLNLDMIGHPWSMDEIRKLVGDTGLPNGEEFLARVRPADFAEPGLPPDAPELAAALRRAGRITDVALHLDRTDGTHGGSDYRDFARAGVQWIRFFGNYFPAYHEPGDTAEALDPIQVQRIARLALATAWLLANR